MVIGDSPRRRGSRALSARRTLPALGLIFGLAAASSAVAGEGSPPAPPAATASWEILGGVATVGLDFSTLAALGFEPTDVAAGVGWHDAHPLSVVPLGAPAFEIAGPIGMRVAVAEDGFHGFEGGTLRLRGGFRLRSAAALLDLSLLVLRPAPRATGLEIFDADGAALLATGDSQWELDARGGQLRYLNADLRLTREAARRLGEPRYEGTTVGVLDLDLTLAVGFVPPVEAINAPPPCGDWSGNIDVSLSNMPSVGQGGSGVVNGRSVVVVLPSAELKNVGTANVPWYAKFTNLGIAPWNDQHPFLVWQMLRAVGGVLEPLGRSDLKHAFLTLNTGCDAGACTDSHVLGLGCGDVYGTSTNNSVGSLAPRSEVTAFDGIWHHCGGIATHFDTNGDCTQDFTGAGENALTHGLKAAESDLSTAGAHYYVEAFYVVRNDINIFNSMGYREVAPAKPASVWTFPTVGAYAQGPAMNAWVNPTTPGPGADNELLDTGTGRLQLAVRTTDLSADPVRRRFAYALQNHDFDRRIRSFHVPVATGAVVENVTYVDGDDSAANDWTASVDASGITWTAPAATTPPAELDYASLVSFRFDTDQPASPGRATLGVAAAGEPSALEIQTLAPSGLVFENGFEVGATTGWVEGGS